MTDIMPKDSDYEKLKEIYISGNGNLEHRDINFVWRLYQRCYTEWCFDKQKLPSWEWRWLNTVYPYSGDGLKEWLRDETHYALIRKGFVWDKEKKRFIGLSDEKYKEIKDKMFKAAVKRSIDFFLKTEEDKLPKGCLRTSLKDWIKD